MAKHPPTRRVPRLLSAGAALAAAAALIAAVPAPAHAATAFSGQIGVIATYEVDAPTCSGSGGSESVASFTSSGASKTATTSDDGSTSNSGDATDNATWSAGAQATVKASQSAAGATMTLTATVQAAVDVDLGEASPCATSAKGQMAALVVVSVEQSGWLSVDASLPRSTDFGFSLLPLTDGGFTTPVATEVTDQVTYSGDVWVDPGQYVLNVAVQGRADADPTTPYAASMSGKATMTASLAGAGAARAAASGPATSYVALPAAINCGDGSLAVPFKKKAGKAASATVFVNGKKKTTLNNPQPGTAAVVKGVGGSVGSMVKVVVDPRKGKNVTATRTYLACS